EAYLLYERRFYEWLTLFTAYATYAISVREAVQRRDEGIAPLGVAEPPLTAEDTGFLTFRVKRLETRLAHAEQPPSLTRHLITNVLIHDEAVGDTLNVSAQFQVYQNRPGGSERVFYGCRNDVLRRADDGWKFAQRDRTSVV